MSDTVLHTHTAYTLPHPTSPPVLDVPALWKLNEQLRHAGRMGCAMRYHVYYARDLKSISNLDCGGVEIPACLRCVACLPVIETPGLL